MEADRSRCDRWNHKNNKEWSNDAVATIVVLTHHEENTMEPRRGNRSPKEATNARSRPRRVDRSPKEVGVTGTRSHLKTTDINTQTQGDAVAKREGPFVLKWNRSKTATTEEQVGNNNISWSIEA